MMTAKRILVIDDDLGIRQIIAIGLKAVAHWDVLTAASGKDGIQIAADTQPDLILLDVAMPEIDGLETLQRLQANASTRAIPVILLTARTQPHEQQRLAHLAICGTLTKPFKIPTLVEGIRSLLHWNKE